MPRSLWTGSLSFGLVNVPVALITAVRDLDLHFTQIHDKDGLLIEVMSQTERAALGRFVMRAKEHLAIVRARDGVLTLTTMLFADEVRPTKDVDAATQKAHKPTPKQVNAAVAVMKELSDERNP